MKWRLGTVPEFFPFRSATPETYFLKAAAAAVADKERVDVVEEEDDGDIIQSYYTS